MRRRQPSTLLRAPARQSGSTLSQPPRGVRMSSARPLSSPLDRDASQPAARLDGWLLTQLVKRIGNSRLLYALGRCAAGSEQPVATVRFRDRRALLRLLLDPEVHFGDAYAEGRIEIEGDLLAALETTDRAMEGRRPGPLSRLSLLVRHTPGRSRDNVHRHYDIGNDFY